MGHTLAFASLFVPDFPVQAVVRLEPELRGQPVAILVDAPPLTKVFAVNRKARNLGVETGLTRVLFPHASLQIEVSQIIIHKANEPVSSWSFGLSPKTSQRLLLF